MTQHKIEMLAACGLDCGSCTIRLIPIDAEAAKGVIDWFKQMGWLKESEGVAEAIERKMYCNGCQSDRSVHWSGNCEIMLCCVDEKHKQLKKDELKEKIILCPKFIITKTSKLLRYTKRDEKNEKNMDR